MRTPLLSYGFKNWFSFYPKTGKIKAAALFYAIFISLIIGLISSALIFYSLTDSKRNFDILSQRQVVKNAESGLNMLLSSDNLSPQLHEEQVINLYDGANDTVLLKREAWGAFELLVSKGYSRKYKTYKTAFAGIDPEQKHHIAIYLADHNKPLSVCGETFIEGDCILPKSGVKRAYIEGKSFKGEKMIHGETTVSNKHIPELYDPFLNHASKMLLSPTSLTDSIIHVDMMREKYVKNSFTNKAVLYLNEETIELYDEFIGKVIFFSEHSIAVSKYATLEDVILIAPSIYIESGFEGTLQAFAHDTLYVGKKVRLHYPSSLNLIRTGDSPLKISLEIDESCMIEGSVLSYQQSESAGQRIRTMIHPNTTIRGHLIAKGEVELMGSVEGTVICEKFILHTKSSVYENHLMDATVSYPQLSEYFAGSFYIDYSTKKRKIAKWLN